MTLGDRIPASALDLDTRVLGDGGQGRIHRVIAVSSTPLEHPLAYKVYKPRWRAAIDAEVLGNLVALRRGLAGAASQSFTEWTAWPQTVVEDHLGQPVGFLMPLLPYGLLRPLDLPGSGEDEYCQLQHLLNGDDYRKRVGISVDDHWRLGFLRNVAAAIAMLHQHRVTVGDLSPLNIYPTFGAVPGCYFVDCDAMALNGRSVLPPAHTRGWEVPGTEAPATLGSDAYKFALLAVRLFAGDQDTRDTSALKRVSKPLGELASSGLAADPQLRPTLTEWVEALRHAATDPTTVYRVAATSATSAAYEEAAGRMPADPPTPASPQAPTVAATSPRRGSATATGSRGWGRWHFRRLPWRRIHRPRVPRGWFGWRQLRPGRWRTVRPTSTRGWRIVGSRTRPVGWPTTPPRARSASWLTPLRGLRTRGRPLWRLLGRRGPWPALVITMVLSVFSAGWWLSGTSAFGLPWTHQPEPTTASPPSFTDVNVMIRFCPYRRCRSAPHTGQPNHNVVKYCRITGENVDGDQYWDFVRDETVDVFGYVNEKYLGSDLPKTNCVRDRPFTTDGVHIRECADRSCTAHPRLGDEDDIVIAICREKGQVVDGSEYWDWVFDEATGALGYASEANMDESHVADARC